MTSILIGIILQYAGTPGVISFIVVSMLMVMLSVGIFRPENAGHSSGEYLMAVAAEGAGGDIFYQLRCCSWR